MIKEIKYKGYTATPSDYDCPDGELDMSLGMIYEDGALRPMREGTVLHKVSITDNESVTILKLCRHDAHKGCVVLKVNKGEAVTQSFIHYANLDSDTFDLDLGEAVYNLDNEELYDVQVIGNTLAIVTSGGIHYAKWDGTTYKHIGMLPEIPEISFGLRIGSASGGIFGYHYYEDIVETEGGAPPTSDEIAELAHRREVEFTSFMGEANKIIAENSKKNFCYPFFIRYALRLYDGTLTKHSAPILMVPAVFNPAMITESPKPEKDHNRTLYMITPRAIYGQLVYNIRSEISEAWNDIIQSVDVFISTPAYTFDQGAKSEDFKVDRTHGLDDSKPLYGCRTGAFHDDKYERRTTSQILGNYIPADGGVIKIPLKDNYIGDIGECSVFYKYATLSIGLFCKTPALDYHSLKADISDLGVLAQQEVMTDDFSSHQNITAKTAFTYNKRLIIGNIRKQIFRGFDVCSSVTHITKTRVGNVRIYLLKNGKTQVAGMDNACIPVSDNGRDIDIPYLFYPDPSAYKIEIMIAPSDGEPLASCILELKPHAHLFGAYYYNDLDYPTLIGQTEMMPLQRLTYDIGNELYVSEVNNPFIFRAENVMAVGNGTILSLSSATQALSEGQFGAFPLYVFTDDGVWSMEVAPDGTFRSAHPVSRDVCVNKDVSQIDNAVVFISSRGVMLIEGSKCTCISDVLKGSAFDVNDYPQLRDVAVLSGYATVKEDKTYDLNVVNRKSFDMFLHGARMLYDYSNQRLILYNQDFAKYAYAYVFSLKSKAWGMMACGIKSSPNSYTDAIYINDKNEIVNLSAAGALTMGLVLTRPLNLDMPDVLKTIDTVLQRGVFAKGKIKSALWGSRDLIHWFLVSSSVNHEMRGFSGTPYKYFRIALICDFSEGESVSGASINMRPKMTNRLR